MKRFLGACAFALAVGCNTPAATTASDKPTDKPVENAPVAQAAAEPLDAGLKAEAKVISEAGTHVYQLTTSVRAPWVIKDTTPFAVTLAPSEGVTPEKMKLGKEDFVDKSAPVKVVQTALKATPGEHTVRADIDMYVCSAELCERKQLHIDTQFAAADK